MQPDNVSSSRIRVLMVSDVYFPRVNGVSTSIETFRRTLRDFSVDVTLVVPRYRDEKTFGQIIRIDGRQVPGDPEDRFLNWHQMHQQTLHAAQYCDLVHIQTPFVAHYAGLNAARKLNKPVLLTYHTFFEEYLHHYAPWLPAALLRAGARYFSRRQCNQVDAVVVPSTAMKARLQDYQVSQPLHVIPTGVSETAFQCGERQRFRRAHQIDPDARVALFVGRVAHEKNIEFLLEVAARVDRILPNFMLIIAGEGPALPHLRQRAAALSLSHCVRFFGYMDRATALPDCYAGADVFVFASRTETQGLVLLEAMAAGVPVVALSAMGTADILSAAQGARVPQDDVGEFAAVLNAVLVDEDARQNLAQEAQQYSAQWSDAQMAVKLAALYRELLQSHTVLR